MTYENLELIVVFNGAKSTFKPADYPGKLVLVTGGYDNTTLTAKDPYLYAIDENGNYRVIDVPSSWVSGIKALKSGSTSEYITLQGVAELLGANGISVSIDSSTKKLTIDGGGLIGKANDQTTANTIYGAKALASKVKSDLLGPNADAAEHETIRGTRKLITDTKAALEGDASADSSSSATIAGAKKYAEEKANAAKADAIANASALAGSAKNEAINSSRVSIDTTSTTEGMLKSYTLKQAGVTIGTIDIPKDLVVSSGSVVTGTWSGTTFTESTSGKDTAIKLVLSNDDKLYINAATLVDVYGVDDTTTIDMTINGTTITASIKAGSVSTTELKDGAVTNAKITEGTIAKSKLVSGVQTSLGKADSSVQSVAIAGTGAAHLTQSKEASTGKVTLSLKTSDVGNVPSDILLGGTPGLATAVDVYNYIKAIMSVKILS